jgi:hypothetical protein
MLATRTSPRIFTSSQDTNKAKFRLNPVRLQTSGGFGRTEINRIQKMVEENREDFLRSWNEFFNG